MTDIFAAPNADAAAEMTGGADAAAPQGRIHYTLQNQNGETAKLGEQDLLQQLHQAGYNPQGLSPDSKLVSFQDHNGSFQAPIEQVFQKLGWDVKGKEFPDSDRSKVNPALTFAINTSSMANDSTKREYLTSYLQHHGIDHPQIDGQGDDWHAFDPSTGRYMALTKGSGAGLDDVAKYGAKAPSFLGAVLGTGLGSGAGPMGMAAGAAGGGFVGGRVGDSLGAMVDPEAYASALGKQGFQQTATGWAKDAGWDALGGLGAGVVGKALPALAERGLASRTAQGIGGAMESGGRGVGRTAEFMSKGLPSEFAQYGLDPTPLTATGDILKSPKAVVQMGANMPNNIGRGIQGIGSHPMVNQMFPDAAESMRTFGRGMREGAPRFGENAGAEEILAKTTFKGAGRLADSLHDAGHAIQAPVRGAYMGAVKGIQGAGRAAEVTGNMLQGAGRIAGPHELNALGHMGSEELRARMMKRQRDLQMQGLDRKLVPDTQLASEDQPLN